MTCDDVHLDLGAYAVGALAVAEAEAVRRHLDSCVACRDELAELERVTALLALLPPAEALAPSRPPDAMLDRLLAKVAVERRRRLTLAGVAAAVAVAAAVLVVALVLAGQDDGSNSERPRGTVVTAVDAGTGVRAEVDVRSVGWGSALRLRLEGMPAGATCSLVAVGRNGARETGATWEVPEGGYGKDAGSLAVDGGVALRRPELDRFEVLTTKGRLLVSVAAPAGG
jgi:predicted anti-sigma-YlaC factor YlaD